MTHPALALQAVVFAALIADAGVGALVGDRIYDDPPRHPTYPFVSFGEARVSDWSTGTEAGAEHRLALNVWSRHRGKAECWSILEAIQAAIDDAALSPDGHDLINLQFETAEVRRDRDRITWNGTARFRAVTELV